VNAATNETMWQTAGQALHAFWTQNVRKPSDLLIPKADLPIALLFGGQFNGIYDPSPLYRLIDQTLTLENMRHVESCKVVVGAVKMGNGQITYVDQHSNDVISFIKASSALPVVLPMVEINGDFYSDGGLRDIVPLQQAIAMGATEIKLIVCQTLALESRNVNTTTLASFVSRALEILTNEVAMNDLHIEPADAARIRVDLIGPSRVLGTVIDNFQAANITDLLEMGRTHALQPKRVTVNGVED
jgi:NTE family protein